MGDEFCAHHEGHTRDLSSCIAKIEGLEIYMNKVAESNSDNGKILNRLIGALSLAAFVIPVLTTVMVKYLGK